MAETVNKVHALNLSALLFAVGLIDAQTVNP
jgi:hypothetical protein